jgi:hypothetical protein
MVRAKVTGNVVDCGPLTGQLKLGMAGQVERLTQSAPAPPVRCHQIACESRSIRRPTGHGRLDGKTTIMAPGSGKGWQRCEPEARAVSTRKPSVGV